MMTLKYVSLVDISTIIFELWEVEIGYLIGYVNNILVCLHVFLDR